MAQAARKASSQEESDQMQLRAAYPELEQALMKRRAEILGQLDAVRANLDEQVMTAPGDEADVSVVDTSADYFLRLANNQQRELLEIRDALDRMDRGIYGLCQSCDETVSVERLRKLPYARLCVDCQAASERNPAAPLRKLKL